MTANMAGPDKADRELETDEPMAAHASPARRRWRSKDPEQIVEDPRELAWHSARRRAPLLDAAVEATFVGVTRLVRDVGGLWSTTCGCGYPRAQPGVLMDISPTPSTPPIPSSLHDIPAPSAMD
jgi:hypothetical protein